MPGRLQTLGKYQLLKKIAAGGMAEIYVARVTGLPGFEKIVVIKRILPQLASNKEFIQMFLDEARVAATLHHPNIVQMYDIGAIDGNYFISMEYLHGEDIRGLMKALRQRGEGLPLEHALNIIIGLASGLHYAHEKVGFDGTPLGIVHRDVTPQNVFVTYDGGVKIVDFGIAKASNRASDTRYGTLKGKIPYMSPEQCRSEPLDRRSDVFAIGILLYELTTGFRLFKGASEFDVLKKIVEHPIAPPASVRPGYPRELERIVMKALAKDRAERYQTAQEIQADLEGFVREHKLVVSSIALSAFMQRIFGQRIEAWREALSTGKDLEERLAERHEEVSDPGSGEKEVSHEDLEERQEAPGAGGRAGGGSGMAAEDREVSAATPTVAGQVSARRRTPPPFPVVQIPTAEELSQIRPRRSRRGWAVVAALGVVAVIAAIALVIKRSGGESAGPGATEPTGGGDTVALAPGPAPASPGNPPVVAPLPGAAGMIKVSSRPEGGVVRVDGREWPERTVTVVDNLEPGEHVVEVEVPGRGSQQTTVTVAANETADVFVDLAAEPDAGPAVAHGGGRDRRGHQGGKTGGKGTGDRGPRHGGKTSTTKTNNGTVSPPQPAGEGELRIASTPSCEVIVDGRSRGSTPLAGLKLAAGNHTVQLVNSRFGIDRTYAVPVKPWDVTKRRYDFPVNPE